MEAILHRPWHLLRDPSFQKYFRNTSWILSEQVLRLVAGIFVGIYVARYLGPEQFGTFSYVTALVTLAGSFAKLGLDNIVVRDLVKFPEERSAVLGTAFWMKGIAGLIAAALLVLVIPFIDDDRRTAAYAAILGSGLVLQAFDVVGFHFQARAEARYVSVCRLTQLAASSVLKLVLVLYRASLLWFVVAALLDQVLLSCAYVLVAWRKQMLFDFTRMSRRWIAQLARDAWPMIAAAVAITLYLRLDQILIKARFGEGAVGVYSAAVRLSEVWSFVPTVICASVFPAIVSSKALSDERYYKRLESLFSLLIVIAIGVAIAVTLFSTSIITLLYGSRFRGAAPILAIHIWSGVFSAIGSANEKWFIVERKTILHTRNTVIGAMLNVVLNWLLIPYIGPIGGAVTAVATQFVTAYVLLALDPATRRSFVVISGALALRLNRARG